METTVLEKRESTRFTIKPDSLAQSIMLLLSLTMIQRAAGFGRSLLLCRWLPVEELGHWDLSFAFLELAAPIAVLSIPACFSRYVEYYRQKGQLRVFIRRTALAVSFMLSSSVALIYWGSSWFSQTLFGDDNSVSLLWLLLLVLPAVIIFNTINELFGGLRMYRRVTLLQFMQSILFAGMALSLAGFWHAGAGSIVAGYGLACMLCSAVPLYWLARMWWGLPSPDTSQSQITFWGKLLPFIGSVWLTNLLGNFFFMSDRYMLLHYSGMDATHAAAAVGQYHSARVVPLLIIQLSAMIGTMFIPYLSYDWEAGRRDIVGVRLNLFLKVVGLGLTALTAMIILASPLLFTTVFAGKFSAGEAVLPWTLLCSVWYSMFCIVRSYLWCDERVWLVGLGYVTALAVNVGAGLLLLPAWGLQGTVWAASIASLTIFLVTCGLAMWRGLRISFGTWIVSAVPAVICFGLLAVSMVLAGVAVASLATNFVFTRAEKKEIATFVRDYIVRWQLKATRWRKLVGLGKNNLYDAGKARS